MELIHRASQLQAENFELREKVAFYKMCLIRQLKAYDSKKAIFDALASGKTDAAPA